MKVARDSLESYIQKFVEASCSTFRVAVIRRQSWLNMSKGVTLQLRCSIAVVELVDMDPRAHGSSVDHEHILD